MFEEFYEMYETEEQEVVALINRCIGGGFNSKGNFWEMTVVTLGIVSCDTGQGHTKEERLDWPVTDEERHSDKGWGRFQNEQICRLKIRRMKEENTKRTPITGRVRLMFKIARYFSFGCVFILSNSG